MISNEKINFMTLKNIFGQGWLGNIIALFGGALLPLAFAPINIYPLAFISPALLLALLLQLKPGQSFWRGFFYGLGFFGVGVSWVFISIHRYGNTNAVLSFIFTLLFVAVLALFTASQGYLFNRLFLHNNRLKIVIAFPAIWVLIEWIRSWIFTGFPWLFLGYSQTNSLFKSFAPIVGIYGLSFIITLCSGLLVLIVRDGIRGWYKNLIPLILFGVLALLLGQIKWTHPIGNSLRISLVQGNIPQSIKWEPQQAAASLDIYRRLTDEHWNSDIIVWPESAITFLLSDATGYLNDLSDMAKQHHTAILSGIPISEFDDKTNSNKYYSSMIVMGDGHGRYYKQHLVPFGEYVPFQNLLRGLFGFLNLPMSDFSDGTAHQQLLNAKGFNIAPFICYEIAFPNLVIAAASHANLLVTISDDTWFEDSLAPGQHLQMGQFWALATGRDVLFGTNSGTTAIINANGKIVATIPKFQQAVLIGTAQAMQGKTPAMILGNIWPLLIITLLLIFAWLFSPNNKYYH